MRAAFRSAGSRKSGRTVFALPASVGGGGGGGAGASKKNNLSIQEKKKKEKAQNRRTREKNTRETNKQKKEQEADKKNKRTDSLCEGTCAGAVGWPCAGGQDVDVQGHLVLAFELDAVLGLDRERDTLEE